MFTVLATSFAVAPTADATIQASYQRVRCLLRGQIETFAKTFASNVQLDWTSEVTWQSESGQATLHWEEWEHSGEKGCALAECKITYEHQQHNWAVDVRCGMDADSTRVDVSAVWSRSAMLGQAYPLFAAPPLLRAFSVEDCCTHDLSLRYTPQQLSSRDIKAFYDNVLSSPNRCTPIVLISPREYDQVLLNPDSLAMRLFGLAAVYRLADDDAAQALRDLTPAACYAGAIRLYWPFQEGAVNHPFWLSRKIDELGPMAIEVELFQRIAQASRGYIQTPDTLRSLERQRGQDQSHERRAYRQENESYFKEIADLDEKVRSLEAHNARLQEEVYDQREQIDDLARERDRLEGRCSYFELQNSQLEQELAAVRAALPAPNECGAVLWLSPQATKKYHDAEPKLKR